MLSERDMARRLRELFYASATMTDSEQVAAARAVLGKPVATISEARLNDEMRLALRLALNGSGVTWNAKAVNVCSQVAFRLFCSAPARERAKMQIEEMSKGDLEIAFDRLEDIEPRVVAAIRRCAKIAHRLANTPAEVAPDPDAHAKELFNIFAMELRRRNGADYVGWETMAEPVKAAWRHVASVVAENAQKAPAP